MDRPGHGWNDRIFRRDGASPRRQAELLRRAADRLGVREAIVVTHSRHSWRGGVAWYYMLGAHALVGPPFRRLLTLPLSLAWMRAGVAQVFAPNRALPE